MMTSLRTALRLHSCYQRARATGLSFRNYQMAATTNYTSKVDNVAECIDLRSDTVTLPSEAMKKAVMEAKLGDDVYAEDPTTAQLEERCASLFGKESGLFVASGTMGNLIAVMVYCGRGDEIIVGRYNHIHRWEQGNYAQLASVSATTLPVNSDGTMDLADIEEAIRVKDSHMPHTKLICLETTHNYSGGKPLSIEYLKSVRELADRYNLSVHIDGARIYNAAVALGVQVLDIAKYADSVMMCFSKGLGAPVGSILVGSTPFIAEARRKRKALGGGWRQSGMLAAAAGVSLDMAVDTLTKDHRNAKKLAEGIAQRTPDVLEKKLFVADFPVTNMVVLHCKGGIEPAEVMNFFKSHNVLVMSFDATRVRIVTNWGVGEREIEKTLDVYSKFIHSKLIQMQKPVVLSVFP